ncbi:hypothetical protein AKJ16_DCAP22739 [Drosera capensis]
MRIQLISTLIRCKGTRAVVTGEHYPRILPNRVCEIKVSKSRGMGSFNPALVFSVFDCGVLTVTIATIPIWKRNATSLVWISKQVSSLNGASCTLCLVPLAPGCASDFDLIVVLWPNGLATGSLSRKGPLTVSRLLTQVCALVEVGGGRGQVVAFLDTTHLWKKEEKVVKDIREDSVCDILVLTDASSLFGLPGT